MRSRYRCRYRVSVSFNPWYLSGSGRSDLLSKVIVCTLTLSSPFLVVMTGPRRPNPVAIVDLVEESELGLVE